MSSLLRDCRAGADTGLKLPQNLQGGRSPLARSIGVSVVALWSMSARARTDLSSRHRWRRRHRRRTRLDSRQLLAVELFGRRVVGAGFGSSAMPGHPMRAGAVMPASGHGLRRGRGARGGRCGRRRRTHRRARLRPCRGSDRKGRSDRDAVQEMLHASILCGSSDGKMRCKGWGQPEGGPSGRRARNNLFVAPFP